MMDWKDCTNGDFKIDFIKGEHWDALSDDNLPLIEASIKAVF